MSAFREPNFITAQAAWAEALIVHQNAIALTESLKADLLAAEAAQQLAALALAIAIENVSDATTRIADSMYEGALTGASGGAVPQATSPEWNQYAFHADRI